MILQQIVSQKLLLVLLKILHMENDKKHIQGEQLEDVWPWTHIFLPKTHNQFSLHWIWQIYVQYNMSAILDKYSPMFIRILFFLFSLKFHCVHLLKSTFWFHKCVFQGSCSVTWILNSSPNQYELIKKHKQNNYN